MNKTVKKNFSVLFLIASLTAGNISAYAVHAAETENEVTAVTEFTADSQYEGISDISTIDISGEYEKETDIITAEDQSEAADIQYEDTSEISTVGASAGDENETEIVSLDDDSDEDINTPEIDINQKIDISNASVAGVSLSYGYSGKAYTPAMTIKVSGITLTEGRDYVAEYKNNTNPGTATITIKGKNNYTGTRIKTFEIVDCVSSLVSGETYQLIPKNNSKTAVCSFAGRMVNNTKVYITDRSSSEAMKFKAVKNSDGSWKFINAKCELALAVQQNSREVGKGLVLYDQTTREAQNWKLSKKSDNSFAIMNAVTGYSVAMSDASAAKGTTLSMAESASSGLQRFYIVKTSPVNAPFDGIRAIRSSKNNKFALNVASSSKADGANINLYTYSNTGAKRFNIMYSGSGYYRIVNVNSGLCLSVKGNTKTDGANIIQSKWASESGQRWLITQNSDGTVTFTNALGTVLHLVGNKTADGTNVAARKAATTTAQKWYLK